MAQSFSDKGEALAKNLKGIMKEYGITQKELALKLNVPKSTVSAWCRGIKIPSTALVKELSRLFGIKKETLFQDENIDAEGCLTVEECGISNEALKEALFGKNTSATDKQLEEVKSFARFIIQNDDGKNSFDYRFL